MSCSIESNIINNMVEKGLMEYNESRRLYQLSAPAYKFNQEAARVQDVLETTYDMQTEPVVYLQDSQVKAIRGNSYFRDTTVRNTLVRFRGAQIERFQELADISPEKEEKIVQERIAEAERNIQASLKLIMNQLGISFKVAKTLTDNEGNLIAGVAVADLINKSIVATLGNESELTEEITHFYVNALKDTGSALYNSMRSRIFTTPEYAEVSTKYRAAISEYTEEDIIDEAIAKVMVNRATDENINDRESRWWKRAWQAIKNMFNLEDPYVKAAYKMFNNDLTKYQDAIDNTSNNTLFRSLGTATPAELIKGELISTHNKLSIKTDITKELAEGKIKNFELFEDDQGVIARYMLEQEDGTTKMVTRRATDDSTISFMRNMGGLEAVKGMQKNPKSAFARDAGTNLHNVGQFLVEDEASKMKGASVVDLEDSRVKLTESDVKYKADLTDNMFKEFRGEMKRLLTQVRKTQDTIAKDKDFEVFTEVQVYDKATDTAGTIDILFLFSDGSVAIYDFKFIAPKQKFTEGAGASKKIVIDPFRGGKRESYDSQLGIYATTLSDNYSIGKIRMSRIIPGHMDFSWSKAGIPTGINTFNIGKSKNKFLQHISVAKEYTDDKRINAKLSEIYNRLTELNKMKPSAKIRREKDVLYRAVQSLVVESNLGELLETLNETINKATDYASISDEDSENYMSFDELQHSLDLLQMFSDINAVMVRKAKSLKTKKEKTAVYDDIAELSRSVEDAVEIIEEELLRRSLVNSRLDTTIPYAGLGFLDKFIVMDQIENPIFQEGKRRINITHDIIARRVEELRRKWFNLDESLQLYAESKNMSLVDVYEMFIEDTGEELKLIPMFKKEFWEEVLEKVGVPDEVKKESVAWMKERFQIKEGAKESYNKALKKRIEYLKREYPNKGKAYNAYLKSFKDNYNVFGGNPSAWASPKYWMYLEVKPEYAKEVWSESFEKLNQPGNEALLTYFNAWKEQLREYNEEMDGVYLSGNTIPTVRKTLIENFTRGKDIFSKDFIQDWWSRGFAVKVDEDDTSGGNPIQKVPLPFINALKNRKGDKSSQLVSRDLSRSMYMMGASIYNYIEKSKIESEMLFLRHQLHTKHLAGQQLKTKSTKRGTEIIRESGKPVLDEEGLDPDTLKLFDQFFNYYMYGHSYSSKDKIIGNVSMQKLVSKLNALFSYMKISVPVKLAISTKIAGSLFTYVEGMGGVHYGTKELSDSLLMFAKDRDFYYGITDYFNLHTQGREYHRGRRMHATVLTRNLDTSFMYEPLGMTDRSIDRTVAVAMMQNYGLGKDGLVKRLNQLPEGSKSILEIVSEKSTVDKKTGEVVVDLDALPDEAFTQFRQVVKKVVGGIKGEQGEDNIVAAHTELAFRLLGTFKWWAPAFVLKRYGGRRYDYIEDAPVEGRFIGGMRAILGKQSTDETNGYLASTAAALERVYNAFSHLAFLRSYTVSAERKARLESKNKWSEAKEERYKRQRAAIQLELDFVKANTTDPDMLQVDLESYIEMREASTRSFLAEARIVLTLSLIGMLFGARGFNDDDEPLKNTNYGTRLLSDILAKVILETTFAMNPLELQKLNQSAIPTLGLVDDAFALVKAGYRSTSATFKGEELDARTKGFPREVAETFVPGYNQFIKFVGQIE